MAVKTTDITNQEQGSSLQNRAVKGADVEARTNDAADALAAMKSRIEAAKKVEPTADERHCVDCFQRGRNAAIRTILGE